MTLGHYLIISENLLKRIQCCQIIDDFLTVMVNINLRNDVAIACLHIETDTKLIDVWQIYCIPKY